MLSSDLETDHRLSRGSDKNLSSALDAGGAVEEVHLADMRGDGTGQELLLWA